MSVSATVSIDTSKSSASRVHPYVWGNFIEDFRDHMDAMLAYPLQGMDFEQCSTAQNGVSEHWTPITNGKSTQFHLEPANTADQPTRIGCDTFEVATREASLQYTLQPHSVYGFTLS